MIKFYRVDASDTLLVYDTVLRLYAPFTLSKRKAKCRRDLLQWWGCRCVSDYCNSSAVTVLVHKKLGMEEIK